MTAHSVAPDVTEAVVGALQGLFAGLADFNGTTRPEDRTVVSYGFDFGNEAAEQVYLGRMRAETPPAALRTGRNFRNESGTFDLTVLVKKPGADASVTVRRAFVIGRQVEDWFSLHKGGEGLNVNGLQTLLVESWEADYAGLDSGTGAVLTFTLAWTARLDESVT